VIPDFESLSIFRNLCFPQQISSIIIVIPAPGSAPGAGHRNCHGCSDERHMTMDEHQGRPQTTGMPHEGEEVRLAREVDRVLAGSGRFRSGQLEVSASERHVTLRGHVASYYQKQVAQAAALAVIGGRQLVNEIEVG
jgi:osmotically-inducible protein OsmY